MPERMPKSKPAEPVTDTSGVFVRPTGHLVTLESGKTLSQKKLKLIEELVQDYSPSKETDTGTDPTFRFRERLIAEAKKGANENRLRKIATMIGADYSQKPEGIASAEYEHTKFIDSAREVEPVVLTTEQRQQIEDTVKESLAFHDIRTDAAEYSLLYETLTNALLDATYDRVDPSEFNKIADLEIARQKDLQKQQRRQSEIARINFDKIQGILDETSRLLPRLEIQKSKATKVLDQLRGILIEQVVEGATEEEIKASAERFIGILADEYLSTAKISPEIQRADEIFSGTRERRKAIEKNPRALRLRSIMEGTREAPQPTNMEVFEPEDTEEPTQEMPTREILESTQKIETVNAPIPEAPTQEIPAEMMAEYAKVTPEKAKGNRITQALKQALNLFKKTEQPSDAESTREVPTQDYQKVAKAVEKTLTENER